MNVIAFFERRGWIILMTISVIFLLFGIGDIIRGMDADPAIAEAFSGMSWDEVKETQPDLARVINGQTRAVGGNIIVIALFSMAIVWKPYRQSQKWAWYAMWGFPLWMVFIFATMFFADRPSDSPTPPPMISAPIFFVVLVVTLLMSYHKFFANDQVGAVLAESAASKA